MIKGDEAYAILYGKRKGQRWAQMRLSADYDVHLSYFRDAIPQQLSSKRSHTRPSKQRNHRDDSHHNLRGSFPLFPKRSLCSSLIDGNDVVICQIDITDREIALESFFPRRSGDDDCANHSSVITQQDTESGLTVSLSTKQAGPVLALPLTFLLSC